MRSPFYDPTDGSIVTSLNTYLKQRLPVSTLSSFYQQQCLPRLRKFNNPIQFQRLAPQQTLAALLFESDRFSCQ
jgi:hypothetical protein